MVPLLSLLWHIDFTLHSELNLPFSLTSPNLFDVQPVDETKHWMKPPLPLTDQRRRFKVQFGHAPQHLAPLLTHQLFGRLIHRPTGPQR